MFHYVPIDQQEFSKRFVPVCFSVRFRSWSMNARS